MRHHERQTLLVTLDNFVLPNVPQWENYEEMERQQQGAPPHFTFLFVHRSTDLFLVGGLVVEDQQKGVCVIYFLWGVGVGRRWVC
jgi:hypothetical protein